MNLLQDSWVLPLLPLVAFVLITATGRKLPTMVAPAIGIAAMSGVFASSLALLWMTIGGQAGSATTTWLHIGGVPIELGVAVDELSSLMLVIVSLVSLLVQIYSIGYMHSDERFRWYYAAISLFTAAMLGVVLANGWLLMYMCWELMGLASYLLIGFWYEQPVAARAAAKAFLVTRIGDVGFGLALVFMWTRAHSFQFEEVFHLVETGGWVGPTLIATALLLFMGAMGKSAQFPLHVWLPDAMAGPTPGSALIHAATMVAAGVYLVARSFPLFEANHITLQVVAAIGMITALMAALIAVTMDDIKKMLAYSTISQLGLMMLALGVGNWVAAIFHLMTHAFFKALLFLAAGSVIHATHTQDLHEMGGLWRKMPITAITWIIGSLSLAGIPPLAGFWSKDEILLSVMHGGNVVYLILAVLTAGLTAFYMGRATFLAFFATPGPASKSEHAHESPAVMTVPLVVLAALAVVAGFVNSPFAHYAFGAFLGEHGGEFSLRLAVAAVAVSVGAIAYAWLMYVKEEITPDWYMKTWFAQSVLARTFRIDDMYEFFVLAPIMVVSEFFGRIDSMAVDGAVRGAGWVGMVVSKALAIFDRSGIDGAVDGLGSSVIGAGRGVRKALTGDVQIYLLMFVASIVLLVVVFVR
ncbi:MAG: NADH-quinone oxidoreductase subunit L [Coriobacteriia bacterium]|nr:NADH-quinone oxidoreductase subunit L [Coriobacteriia bacterium]